MISSPSPPADSPPRTGPKATPRRGTKATADAGAAKPARTEDATAQKAADQLRIGDVARLVDTTPRTIRYYEEIGLLQAPPERESGQHRLYSQREVERLREMMRLKHLLGVSLEELKRLLAAEEARSAVKAQLKRDDVEPRMRKDLLEEALGHIDLQIELVERRASELEALRQELAERRDSVKRKLKALKVSGAGPRQDP